MFLITGVRRYLKENHGFKGILLRQSLLAALFTILAFLYALIFNASMSYMGNTDASAASFVIKNFWDTIIIIQVKILVVYLFFFLLIGFVSSVFQYFLFFALNKKIEKKISKRIGTKTRFWIGLFTPITIIIHLAGYHILHYPQVFSRTLFEKGGVRRFIQVFFTDTIGNSYYIILLILFIISLFSLVIYFIYKTKSHLHLVTFFKKAAGKKKQFISGIVLLLIFVFFLSLNSSPVKFKGYNLLILASDALRPDRLSCMGYHRKTSPNIDRLMKEGLVFNNTFIEVPRTFPSWVSILCSQYSRDHGIRHMFPSPGERKKYFPSINYALKKRGYKTAVISDFAGDVFTRIKLGFDLVKTPYFNFDALLKQGSLEIHTFLFPFILNSFGRKIFPVLNEFAQLPEASLLADKTISTISDFSKKGNFFVTVFFSTTHFPYANVWPYYKTYADPRYKGAFKYYKQNIVLSKQKGLSKKDKLQVNALYDGGVKAMDDASGRIIKFLKDKGLLKNTIVVLLSDHGENLYEPGMGMGHGEHLRGDYATRIPFMIYHPDYNNKMKKIDRVVRVIDIAPTLSGLLSAGYKKGWKGIDLSGYITGKVPVVKNLTAYAETGIWFSDLGDYFFQKNRIMYPDITKLSKIDFSFNREIVVKKDFTDIIITAKHRMIRDDQYKLIYMPTGDGVKYELYDMQNDRDCRINLVKRLPGVLYKMKKRLFDYVKNGKKSEILNEYIIMK